MVKANYDAGNSALSRTDRTHKQNLQSIINTLAGRGLLFSGDTGYQSNQENTQYGNQSYDLHQQALADILGYRRNALQQQQGLHQGVVDALMQAYQNYLNHPELGGYGKQPPLPAPPAGGQHLPPPPKPIGGGLHLNGLG